MKKINIRIISIAALLIIAIFGVLATLFNLLNQGFTKDSVLVNIAGPENIRMGDEIEYKVMYENTGNFVLKKARLTFYLPQHSLHEDSSNLLTEDLPDIEPGQQKEVIFKARLLGKEGEVKTVRAVLSYVVANLSARYENETLFSTTIDEVPIAIEVRFPNNVKKGQNVSYTINYSSDVDYPLENMSIKVDRINSFAITSSTPDSVDNIEWKLPVLEKGNEGIIGIQGIVAQDAPSPMRISLHLGVWVDGAFVVLKNSSKDVELIDPPVTNIQLEAGL